MTVLQLKRMRSGAREKALAVDPVLRQEWEKALAEEKQSKPVVIDTYSAKKIYTFCCSECGNRFTSNDAFFAKCDVCGEDTNGMVSMV